MNLPIEELQQLFPDHRLASNVPSSITMVSRDTREEMSGGLYVPIVGERFNGHDFAADAVKQGAVALLWARSETLPPSVEEACSIFFVDDTIEGLQKLAAHYVKNIHPVVIAITGSNGKTTVKDLVASVCKERGRTHQTAGNLNNHIGVPLTILSMSPDTEYLVLEMGMNHKGEIECLSDIAQPSFAIITNIGESHIEYLGSREGIAEAKKEIAYGLQDRGMLIVDGDEPLLDGWETSRVKRIGFSPTSDSKLVLNGQNHREQRFALDGEEYTLPFLGEHNVKNAAYAVTIGKALKMETAAIQRGLTQATMTPMRMERLEGPNGSIILQDAYNASPTSMKAALKTLKSLEQATAKIAVLGDIFELGNMYEAEMHRSVGREVSAPVTHLVAVGERAKWIAEEARKQGSVDVQHVLDTTQAAERIKPLLKENAVVLFKASRGMRFEQIVDALKDK
ncbi:UDP-N-acetylmuramoyl-tripeptide--D-alanyl-D-alanine ligase [Litoribacterium kuwaitense]|uniref:UDP-N-acetylmuramoyl-tripeptide--D-alanyl-D- alanine ligase n=1 Tax=Litoribacterium kuwaitense TaxID=1398745 RepID=UPI0013E9C8FB|nr:UDP-N-acetylmuramoyl-tripeptide--D-alanyl-D-alanine ligase [Litoribacterium kuwaitense]